jgi:hypothetical protein
MKIHLHDGVRAMHHNINVATTCCVCTNRFADVCQLARMESSASRNFLLYLQSLWAAMLDHLRVVDIRRMASFR